MRTQENWPILVQSLEQHGHLTHIARKASLDTSPTNIISKGRQSFLLQTQKQCQAWWHLPTVSAVGREAKAGGMIGWRPACDSDVSNNNKKQKWQCIRFVFFNETNKLKKPEYYQETHTTDLGATDTGILAIPLGCQKSSHYNKMNLSLTKLSQKSTFS